MKNYRTLLIVVPRLVSYLGFLRELCGTLIADRAEVHVACSPAPLCDEEIASAEDGVQLHHIEFPRGMNPAAHLRAARAPLQPVNLLPGYGHTGEEITYTLDVRATRKPGLPPRPKGHVLRWRAWRELTDHRWSFLLWKIMYRLTPLRKG
jgi:hypothetical protein